jgi:hypothetical protein
VLAVLGWALACGCEAVDAPVGLPRCEPEHEHEVDRRLKLGFKALVLGEAGEARALFRALLAEEPMHPEAQLGLRFAEGKQAIRSEPPERPSAAGEDELKSVVVAGERLPVEVAVDKGRWRFEELRELAPLRRARDGAGGVFDFYGARTLDGAPVAAEVPAVTRAVDLVVLHDTHTRTAREAVVELEGRGGSTHFVIDWDGVIFQTLDLAWEANHSQQRPIDARSVSIDLVNPVELGDKPGLPDEAEARGEHRPLSDFVRLQGEEVQQWGYTAAQLRSLEALVRGLGKHFPRVPMRAPREGGKVPRGVLEAPDKARGVVGHLHVSRRALDPGAGFPWEAFESALQP